MQNLFQQQLAILKPVSQKQKVKSVIKQRFNCTISEHKVCPLDSSSLVQGTCLQDTGSFLKEGCRGMQGMLRQGMHSLLLPATCLQCASPARQSRGSWRSTSSLSLQHLAVQNIQSSCCCTKHFKDRNCALLRKTTLHFVRCNLFHERRILCS